MKPILLLILFCLFGSWLKAQPAEGWDETKLMSQRLINTDRLRGSPFLFDDWIEGSVELTNGEVKTGVPLKFDAFRDELLSYSKTYFTVLKIEKATIKSFQFEYRGENWYFEQRYFDGLLKGEHFYRVLHRGEVDLLYQYRVEKMSTSVYKDESGVSKMEEFVPVQRYFFYTEKSGFSPTSLKRKSLFRHVAKDDLKQARQLLRQNNIVFGTSNEFARAISVLEASQISLHF